MFPYAYIYILATVIPTDSYFSGLKPPTSDESFFRDAHPYVFFRWGSVLSDDSSDFMV